jgi:hypothetical protein
MKGININALVKNAGLSEKAILWALGHSMKAPLGLQHKFSKARTFEEFLCVFVCWRTDQYCALVEPAFKKCLELAKDFDEAKTLLVNTPDNSRFYDELMEKMLELATCNQDCSEVVVNSRMGSDCQRRAILKMITLSD